MKITEIVFREGKKIKFHKKTDLEYDEKELINFRKYFEMCGKFIYGENTSFCIKQEQTVDILEVMEGLYACMDGRKLSKYSYLLGENRLKELTDKLGVRKHFKGVKIELHSDKNVVTYKLT